MRVGSNTGGKNVELASLTGKDLFRTVGGQQITGQQEKFRFRYSNTVALKGCAGGNLLVCPPRLKCRLKKRRVCTIEEGVHPQTRAGCKTSLIRPCLDVDMSSNGALCVDEVLGITHRTREDGYVLG